MKSLREEFDGMEMRAASMWEQEGMNWKQRNEVWREPSFHFNEYRYKAAEIIKEGVADETHSKTDAIC